MSSSDDKRLERIELKLDDVADEQARMNVILGQQHISLKEHVRRSNLLEAQMKPLQKHVYMVEGFFKYVGAIAVILGALATLFEVLRMYFKI